MGRKEEWEGVKSGSEKEKGVGKHRRVRRKSKEGRRTVGKEEWRG